MSHHITVRLDNKDIALDLHCTEPPEAWCRAETRGECVYRQYLPEDVLVESYDGPGTQLHSAPVEFSWDGESYSWKYSTELDDLILHGLEPAIADRLRGAPRTDATVVPLRRHTDEDAR